MKKNKIKRFIVMVVILFISYLLQCTVFQKLTLASIKPNLLLIITASIGFIDIQFGTMLGFYALIYLIVGYINGMFQKMYYDDNIKLPLCLIAGSELFYGITVYLFMFMLRSEFNFLYYLNHIIIPELIYTIAVTIGLYPLILFINHKLEAEEKRSASKFV